MKSFIKYSLFGGHIKKVSIFLLGDNFGISIKFIGHIDISGGIFLISLFIVFSLFIIFLFLIYFTYTVYFMIIVFCFIHLIILCLYSLSLLA